VVVWISDPLQAGLVEWQEKASAAHWAAGAYVASLAVIQPSQLAHSIAPHAALVCRNLAVGGLWPQYPDATTPFPSTFTIDYVRVWGTPL